MKYASILRHSMIFALLGCSSAIAMAQILTQSAHCCDSREVGNGPCMVQATGAGSPAAGVAIVSMGSQIGLQEHTDRPTPYAINSWKDCLLQVSVEK